jgi:hypothetical protein
MESLLYEILFRQTSFDYLVEKVNVNYDIWGSFVVLDADKVTMPACRFWWSRSADGLAFADAPPMPWLLADPPIIEPIVFIFWVVWELVLKCCDPKEVSWKSFMNHKLNHLTWSSMPYLRCVKNSKFLTGYPNFQPMQQKVLIHLVVAWVVSALARHVSGQHLVSFESLGPIPSISCSDKKVEFKKCLTCHVNV